MDLLMPVAVAVGVWVLFFGGAYMRMDASGRYLDYHNPILALIGTSLLWAALAFLIASAAMATWVQGVIGLVALAVVGFALNGLSGPPVRRERE